MAGYTLSAPSLYSTSGYTLGGTTVGSGFGNTSSYGAASSAGASSSLAGGAGIALAAFGAISSASASYFEQRSIASTNEMNASLTRANETIKQAMMAVEVTKLEEAKESFIGAQVAKVAKSGFKFSGSVLKVVEESIKNFNRDISMLKINAAVSQAQATQTADIYGMQSSYAKRMAVASAANQIATGSANIGLQLYRGQ